MLPSALAAPATSCTTAEISGPHEFRCKVIPRGPVPRVATTISADLVSRPDDLRFFLAFLPLFNPHQGCRYRHLLFARIHCFCTAGSRNGSERVGSGGYRCKITKRYPESSKRGLQLFKPCKNDKTLNNSSDTHPNDKF